MDFKKLKDAIHIADTVLNSNQGIDHNVVMEAMFGHRFSSEDSFSTSWNSLVYLQHKDFESLRYPSRHYFKSGENTLCGYLYRVDYAKGLIIYVHGMSGSAFDWYAIGQNEWLRRGYDVFAIELTASGNSEGNGIKSLSQSAFDVAEAVKYVQSVPTLSGLPLFLFGHSWGGYGVCGALSLISGVKAVASLSGFATPLLEMVAVPAAKVHGLPIIDPKPLEEALYKRAGENANLSAIESIRRSSVPVMAVHGGEDKVVPYQEASILYHGLGLSSLTPVYIENREHVNIFFSENACKTLINAFEIIKGYKQQYGKDFHRIPVEIKQRLEASINKEACSEINQQLFDEIDFFFQRHI